MKKIVVFLLIFMLMPLSVHATEISLVAESAILMEEETGKIIYEKNANAKMYPASITKILTAMVLLDYFNDDEVVVIGNEVLLVPIDSSKAGHIVGESITIKNIVRGLIIPSGNDTSNTVAKIVAERVEKREISNFEECENIFSNLINKKAAELGAHNTHFTNPHGYHAEEHYTTAYDMALIIKNAVEYKIIKDIAKEKSYEGDSLDGKQIIQGAKNLKITWKSHNLLLQTGEWFYQYATGLKTGFTSDAGHCLAATAEKDGVNLISIVFKSTEPERYADTIALFSYGFDNYENFVLHKSGDIVGSIGLKNYKLGTPNTLEVYAEDSLSYFIAKEDSNKIVSEIMIDENIADKNSFVKAPILENTKIGQVVYKLDDETIGVSDVFAKRTVEKRTLISSIVYAKDVAISNIFSIKGLLVVIGIIVLVALSITIKSVLNKRGRNHRNKYKW